MKKIFIAMAVAAMMGVGMSSCNNQPQKNDTKKSETKGSVADSKADLKIAYVEIDTIFNQFQYCKDADKILKGKGANIDKTLQGKQQSLQQAAQKFQQDYQGNKFSSQSEFQQAQANLERQSNDASALEQRLKTELAKEQNQYMQATFDSIHHFLAEYNKDKKFSLILTKQGDNILYANDALDITDQVVAGLNKRYKGMKK